MEKYKENVKALEVFAFLRGVGAATFQTLFPLYLVDLGYQIGVIGVLSTLAMIPGALLLPLIGLFIDLVGRKPMIILTGISVVLALLVPSITTLYPLLLLAYTLNYFQLIAGQPARGAMLADSVDSGVLGVAFAKVAMAFTLARSITPFIAGYSVSILGGYEKTFQAAAAISAVGVLYFTIKARETKGARSKSNIWRDFRESIVIDRSTAWIYVFAIVDRFSWFLWWPMLNAHLREYWGMSPEEVGVYSGISSITIFLSGYVLGRLVDRIGYLKGLILSESAGMISSLTIGYSPDRIVLVCGIIGVGISWSLWIPSFNSAIALTTSSEKRGRSYSKVNAVRMGGSVPAPWIGGYMYDYVHYTLPYLASSIIMVLNTIYLVYISRVKRGKET